MGPFKNAIERLITQHMPYPAYVMDRHWRVLLANGTGQMLLPALADGPVDFFPTLMAPGSIARQVLENFGEVAWGFHQHLKNDVMAAPWDEGLRHRLEQASVHLADTPRPEGVDQRRLSFSPVMNLPDGRRIETTAMIARFGSPREVSASELRVELAFAVDEAGDAFFKEVAEEYAQLRST